MLRMSVMVPLKDNSLHKQGEIIVLKQILQSQIVRYAVVVCGDHFDVFKKRLMSSKLENELSFCSIQKNVWKIE